MTNIWRNEKIKTLIIVGGGIGGSACGALLSKANFKTIIFEKNKDTGGKASIYEKKGFKLEAGVHMFSRCENGPHNQVLKELNAEKSLKWIYNDPATEIKYANKSFLMPLLFSKPENMRKFFEFHTLDSNEMDRVIIMFMNLLSVSESGINHYDTKDLKSWVSIYTDNLAIHDFLNSVCMLYFALPYYRASAGEFIHCFRNMFIDSSFGYIKGGSASISKAFIKLAGNNGAEIRTNTLIKRILVKDGKVIGVEQENGEIFNSNMVISNAGLKETVLKLVGEKHFTNEYVNYVKNLKESLGYLSIKIALKEEITDLPCILVMPENSEKSFRDVDAGKPPKTMFLFMPIPSNLDPQLAPPETQLITVGTPCPNNPNTDFEPWIARIKENINNYFPDIFEKALWTEVTTPKDISIWTGRFDGGAIGLAQTPDQTGENRPKAISPIKGLYYVGADVQGRGIGTELAADSALRLISHLIED